MWIFKSLCPLLNDFTLSRYMNYYNIDVRTPNEVSDLLPRDDIIEHVGRYAQRTFS